DGRLPAHQLVPKASVIAMIMNPANTFARPRRGKVQEAARSFGRHLHVLRAPGRTAQEIDAAFATLAQLRAGALLVDSDPFFNARRDQFVALAAHYAVPATYDGREYVVAGGLMSYGGSIAEVYRHAGLYTGKILNGAKPADLPALQPTKVQLVTHPHHGEARGAPSPRRSGYRHLPRNWWRCASQSSSPPAPWRRWPPRRRLRQSRSWPAPAIPFDSAWWRALRILAETSPGYP